jgi:uncharacterized membrane protein YcaP (DUF421 family)
LGEVKMANLENTGAISVVKKDGAVNPLDIPSDLTDK